MFGLEWFKNIKFDIINKFFLIELYYYRLTIAFDLTVIHFSKITIAQFTFSLNVLI